MQKVLPNLSTKSIQFGFYIKEGLFAKSFAPLCQQKGCSFDFTFKKGLFAEDFAPLVNKKYAVKMLHTRRLMCRKFCPTLSTKCMQLRCYILEVVFVEIFVSLCQ